VIIDPVLTDIEVSDFNSRYAVPPPPPPPHAYQNTGLDEYTQFDDPDDPINFSTLHAQLAPSESQCYALQSRAWFKISVSKIEDIQWAKEAFDHLVLKQSIKSMLLGLVQRHKKDKNEVLSDLIPSKGKVRVVRDSDQRTTTNVHLGADHPSTRASWCWQNTNCGDHRRVHTKATVSHQHR
jgi:hypothetical protein